MKDIVLLILVPKKKKKDLKSKWFHGSSNYTTLLIIFSLTL